MLICTATILLKQAVYISTSFHSIPNWIRILASETWSIPEKYACFSGLKCSFEPYWGIIMNNSQFCIISHALNVPAISMHSVFNYWVFSLQSKTRCRFSRNVELLGNQQRLAPVIVNNSMLLTLKMPPELAEPVNYVASWWDEPGCFYPANLGPTLIWFFQRFPSAFTYKLYRTTLW